jgi:hypothetical protein
LYLHVINTQVYNMSQLEPGRTGRAPGELYVSAPGETYVSRRVVAQEQGVCTKTVERWQEQKVIGFDMPIKINGRWYHPRSRLEAARRLRFIPPAKDSVE